MNVDEDAALTILNQRIVCGKSADDVSVEALKQIDEAAKVLDEKDEDVLKTQRGKDEVDVATHDEFVKEWEAKRKSTRGGSSSGVTAKGKKRKGGEGASSKPTSLPAHVLSYEQPYLKTFMPPDSYIWKSRSSGTWNSKVPPYNGFSRSISKHTEDGAVKEVISHAWIEYCRFQGISLESCPMAGLVEISLH